MIFRDAIDAIMGMHRQRASERKAMERARTGILYVGRGTTGAELGKPFVGVRDSGGGREGAGLDEVTYQKQVYIDHHGQPRMAQAGADEAAQRLFQESRALGASVFGGHDRRAGSA
jgi:hypothetical protein